MTGGTLLDVRGLCAGYGAGQVLFDVDLAIEAGAIVGVLGRKGMGKTTLVRAIMGLVRPTAGSIDLAGAPIASVPTHRIARAGVALVPEGRQVFPNLSVEEHLTPRAREAARAPGPRRAFSISFPRSGNGSVTPDASSPAASSRCLRSAARS
jgi:branched-chain amino acid transport system ATP-binding protein